MKLLALSDLHLASRVNRDALATMPERKDDWLIVAGDVGEKFEHLDLAFSTLTQRFAKVIWVPGNHELWSVAEQEDVTPLNGTARYHAMVARAREFGVLTPEDDFLLWEGEGEPHMIVPLFLLYDYSFRPAQISREGVVAWAREEHSMAADEFHLNPAPFESVDAWCHARINESEKRLATLPPELPTVLINHWPLRRDLVRIPRAPRFKPWCGTVLTEKWHRKYRASVVVSGHIHIRRTDFRDDTRFEEVSLGYPRHWDQTRPIETYLRQILPHPKDTRLIRRR